MDRNDTIGVLNNLIETCRDGQEGFQEAAENVVRSDIKHLFTEAQRAVSMATDPQSKELLDRIGQRAIP